MPQRSKTTAEQLERYVPNRPEGQCWQFEGWTNRDGYGAFVSQQRPYLAHRAMYELAVGPIPVGLVIDHLCRNRACCNPSHLEPVTVAENTRRGIGLMPQNLAKTHCVNGHEFSPENTRTTPQGHRRCRSCERAWTLKYSKAQRPRTRLTDADVRAMRALRDEGWRLKDIAQRFGMSLSATCQICKGHAFRDVA